MRKLLLALSFLAMSAPMTQAQTFDPNMVFTVGSSFRLEKPLPPENRFQLTVTAGMPGLKVSDNLFGGTLYTLSPGFGLRTVDLTSGGVSGLGVALGGLTYHVKGGQFVVQVGAFRDVTGNPKSTSVFLSVGGSVTSPKAIAAKRAAEAAKKGNK